MTGAPDVEDYFSLFDETTGITLFFGEGETGPDDLNNFYLGNIDYTANFEDFDDGFPNTNSVFVPDLQKYFAEIYAGKLPDVRTSLQNLHDGLNAYFDDPNLGSGVIPPPANSSPILLHSREFFERVFNITDSGTSLGDFETLYQALGGDAAFENRAAFRDELLFNSFDAFLRGYDFTIPRQIGASFNSGGLPTGGPLLPVYLQEFQQAVETFYALRVGSQDAPSNALNADLTSYEKIFNEFVPQPPLIPFEEVLADFYNDKVAQDGYFLPSHHLRDWITTVGQQQLEQAGLATSVAGTNSQKTLILLKLFRLLVEVIEVLQRVAAAQGQRLEFYAEVQKAYTNLIGEVPIISEANLRFAIAADSFTKTISPVLSFTQASNQSFTERMRAVRSVFGEEAKQHQTTVNQSNEIVTQQANLGTSILQQLSTILTTMFK